MTPYPGGKAAGESPSPRDRRHELISRCLQLRRQRQSPDRPSIVLMREGSSSMELDKRRITSMEKVEVNVSPIHSHCPMIG